MSTVSASSSQGLSNPWSFHCAMKHTLGITEVSFMFLLAGAHVPRRIAEVPFTLGNEVQDSLIISIHDQAFFGRGLSTSVSEVVWSAREKETSQCPHAQVYSQPRMALIIK